MKNKNGKIRRRFVFYGEVQGVGFRWQAVQAASACGVSGWVRNEYDGSVTMEIQGSREAVSAVIAFLNKDRWIRIRSMETTELELNTEERDFRVVY